MLRLVAFALLTGALAGCGGTEIHRRSIEAHGGIKLTPTAGPGYDHTVEIKNGLDFGYDPDVKAQRDDIALKTAAAQCPAGVIVSEDSIKHGEALTGRIGRTYFMRIRCRPA